MKANGTHAAENTQQNLPLSGLPDTEIGKCRATLLWQHPPVRTVRLPTQTYISKSLEDEQTRIPHWSVSMTQHHGHTEQLSNGTTQQRNNTAPWTQHHDTTGANNMDTRNNSAIMRCEHEGDGHAAFWSPLPSFAHATKQMCRTSTRICNKLRLKAYSGRPLV